DYAASDTVKVIEPLDYLYNNQNKLKEKIPRLIGGGPSEIGLALQGAYDILKTKTGQSNYVLILTDGNVAPSIQRESLLAVENLQRRGVKVFTYGVGRDEKNIMSDFLKAVATAGDGLFAGPVYSTRDARPAQISIQWGDPDAKGFGDEFGLITFSLTHFITQGLEPTAVLNGFNQVTPKSNARMLVTTDFGHPALTVMSYGNGRVAALTVFTGGGLGPLLNAENSIIITRTVNWAIGDPQRKQDFYVDIQDARIGEQTKAVIRTEETISAPEVELIKDGDRYTALFTPDRTGFSTFFGATYATNYEREYQEVGMNIVLNETVRMTNGKIFSPEDIDAIVAHVSELSKRT
ncbi:VWA domain-containing protein, partial [Candidatus Woesearchaeota archaeon]|nr:VWA domain-containing protein [Candidatus Woesearchaeota archaeon]